VVEVNIHLSYSISTKTKRQSKPPTSFRSVFPFSHSRLPQNPRSQRTQARSKMPPKPRDFYTTEFSGRDFGWFLPGGSSATQPQSVREDTRIPKSNTTNTRTSRHRTSSKSRSSSIPRSVTHKAPSVRKSPSMFGVSKRPRRTKMAAIVEESTDVYMTPAIIPTAAAEPESKKPGPWSDWYETRDQQRFWRARKLPDDTWGYEFSDTNPSANPKVGRPKAAAPTSNRSLASFFFGIPAAQPAAPFQNTPSHLRPASVFPPPPRDTDPDPESASTSNSSSTGTASRERPNIPLARSSGTTFPSSVSTGKGKGSSLSMLSSERVSTLSRHEEDSSLGRLHTKARDSKTASSSKASPKSKPNNNTSLATANNNNNDAGKPPKNINGSKSRAAATTIISLSLSKPRGKGMPVASLPPPAPAPGINSKKLHNKVKNEKELRIDTKKRVKGWLKDVVPEAAPSDWDDQGLLIYK